MSRNVKLALGCAGLFVCLGLVGLVAVLGGLGTLGWMASDVEGLEISIDLPTVMPVDQRVEFDVVAENVSAEALTVTEVDFLGNNWDVLSIEMADLQLQQEFESDTRLSFDVAQVLEAGETRRFKFIAVADQAINIPLTLEVYGGLITSDKLDFSLDIANVAPTETADLNPTAVPATTVPVAITEGGENTGIPTESSVQIFAFYEDPLDFDNGGYWSGSGSIVTADGLILTNAHVVLPAYKYTPEALVIALTNSADELPVPTYVAEIVNYDAYLDLAVIRITTDLDGNAVDPAALNLPTVRFGNSDEISLGDDLLILGYPGIGGETITATTGVVAGFTQQRGVKGRAYIKTNATMAGGVSGGMALDAENRVIGIPTELGSGSEDGSTVDCRFLADTNSDGEIDEDDVCVPTGGFINALRPVNLAIPLIEEAQGAPVTQQLPAATPTPQQSAPVASGSTNVLFTDDFSDEGEWVLYDNEDVSERIENEEYVVEFPGTDFYNSYAFSNAQPDSVADVSVSFDVRLIDGTLDSGGVGGVCRISDAPASYYFEIDFTGLATIGYVAPPETAAILESVSSVDVRTDGTYNQVKFECIGDQLALYLNGELIVQATSDLHTSGGIAFAAYSVNNGPLTVGIDNLSISEVTSSGSVSVPSPSSSASSNSVPNMEDPYGTEAFEADADAWEFSSENMTGTVDDGLMKINVIKNEWVSNNWWGETFEDIYLQVEARQVDGAPGDSSLSLQCRSPDVDNMYVFDISTDGWYAIWLLEDKEWKTLVEWTPTETINEGYAWNTITVGCVDNTLSMWINDVFIIEIEDDTLASGDLGFGAGVFEGGSTNFEFDNLTLVRP